MQKIKMTLTNKSGLHARPASEFAKLATKFKSNIIVEANDRKCNAKSIMGLLSLGVSLGKEITISTEGIDEKEALDALASLLTNITD